MPQCFSFKKGLLNNRNVDRIDRRQIRENNNNDNRQQQQQQRQHV